MEPNAGMTQQRPHGDGVVADRAAFEAKYQFVRAIGDGGQAGVYEYRRRAAPEKRVAVKEFGSLTSREWRILAAVRHPHICGLVDEARYENPRVRTTKIVVDCMDMNLQSFLQARQRHAGKEGKPSVEENQKNKSADCVSGSGKQQGTCMGKGSLPWFDKALLQQQEKEQRRLHKVKKGGWDGGEGEGPNLPKAAMDVETVREILYAVTLALDYLHHKLIVHLDIKLENILLRLDSQDKSSIARDPESGRLSIKLADFGLAMLLGGASPCPPSPSPSPPRAPGSPPPLPDPETEHTPRFAAAGTCHYMAPEVEFDSRFGVQADIFSLGVVLHVLLTGGRFPQTALGQPAVLRDDAEGKGTIPEVDGLRSLVQAMLHGDPYRRPHAFHILAHPFLAPVRRDGDTLLGDLVDESEKAARVMLLSIRRGQGKRRASGKESRRSGGRGGGDAMEVEGEQACPPSSPPPSSPPPPPRLPALPTTRSLSRSILAQEPPPLPLYTAYMDLAEIDDVRATVVVCGRKEGMLRVKKSEISTLGAILMRERAGSTTELGQVMRVEGEEGERAGMRMEVEAEGGKEEGAAWLGKKACRLQRLVRRSGQPFEYMRDLWVAMVGMEGGRMGLTRESIWSIYQELRRLAPMLAAQAGTALYLPMIGCGRGQTVGGFASPGLVRQAIIQESVGFAQFLAQAIPSPRLECVVLYTWEKDSMGVLMDSLRVFKEKFRGMMSARLDEEEYGRYVRVLHAAAAAATASRPSTCPPSFPPSSPTTGDVPMSIASSVSFSSSPPSSLPPSSLLACDLELESRLRALTSLDSYPDVCQACWALGQYLTTAYRERFTGEDLENTMEGATQVLRYNKDKADFEEEKGKEGGGEEWLSMVGHYDSLRSLHAVLSLLRALGP